MSIQKVLEMADRFVTLAEGEKDDGTHIKTPHNLEYQDQRTRLTEFAYELAKQLRRVIGEMGSDLFTLKERQFDPKMFKMFSAAYQNLISMSKEIQEDKPYIAAEKLVHYVLERPNSIVLDNLDFLAKHHTRATNVDFKPSALFPEIRSIDELRRLAMHLRKYMAENPLINPPGQSAPPAARLPDIVKEYPDFKAEQSDKTNPAVPFSKKQ